MLLSHFALFTAGRKQNDTGLYKCMNLLRILIKGARQIESNAASQTLKIYRLC